MGALGSPLVEVIDDEVGSFELQDSTHLEDSSGLGVALLEFWVGVCV